MMPPLFITLACAVLLVGALDVPCTVTQEAGRTVYRVPEFSATSATDCEYKWNNGTDHVLANNGGMEETGLVVKQSSTTLTTARCLEGIVYKLDCRSEGGPREAKCLFELETCGRYGIIAAAVLLLLVSILAVAFILRCKKRKKKRSKTRSTVNHEEIGERTELQVIEES